MGNVLCVFVFVNLCVCVCVDLSNMCYMSVCACQWLNWVHLHPPHLIHLLWWVASLHVCVATHDATYVATSCVWCNFYKRHCVGSARMRYTLSNVRQHSFGHNYTKVQSGGILAKLFSFKKDYTQYFCFLLFSCNRPRPTLVFNSCVRCVGFNAFQTKLKPYRTSQSQPNQWWPNFTISHKFHNSFFWV